MSAAKVFSQGEMPAVAVLTEGEHFMLRGLATAHVDSTRCSSHTHCESVRHAQATGAVRIAVYNPAVVGLVAGTWNYTVKPGEPNLKP